MEEYLDIYVDVDRRVTGCPGEGSRLQELRNVTKQEGVLTINVLVKYTENSDSLVEFV